MIYKNVGQRRVRPKTMAYFVCAAEVIYVFGSGIAPKAWHKLGYCKILILKYIGVLYCNVHTFSSNQMNVECKLYIY